MCPSTDTDERVGKDEGGKPSSAKKQEASSELGAESSKQSEKEGSPDDGAKTISKIKTEEVKTSLFKFKAEDKTEKDKLFAARGSDKNAVVSKDSASVEQAKSRVERADQGTSKDKAVVDENKDMRKSQEVEDMKFDGMQWTPYGPCFMPGEDQQGTTMLNGSICMVVCMYIYMRMHVLMVCEMVLSGLAACCVRADKVENMHVP
jgi:hypothetical protein